MLIWKREEVVTLTINNNNQFGSNTINYIDTSSNQVIYIYAPGNQLMITSINGNRDSKDIRDFVDVMLARDSRALREYVKEVQPDIDLTFFPNGSDEKSTIPIGLSFFWPDL